MAEERKDAPVLRWEDRNDINLWWVKKKYKTVLHIYHNAFIFVLVRNQLMALEQTFWQQQLELLPETKDTP